MTTKYIVGGSICLFLALTPGTSHAAPVKVGNYVIPSAFARSLEQGMTVPVYIRYNETDEKSQQKIADAMISLVDGNITVKALTLAELPKEGANKRGNSSRLTQSFHFFMFEPI
ncbi:hypothetical protein OGV91_07245, partial [Citrobacter sp. Cf093]|nr:hypothetical protein [Citrobacter sp. Cf093]